MSIESLVGMADGWRTPENGVSAGMMGINVNDAKELSELSGQHVEAGQIEIRTFCGLVDKARKKVLAAQMPHDVEDEPQAVSEPAPKVHHVPITETQHKKHK